MKSLKKLIEILDRWKYLYILSAFLLLASVIFRMLEPRVLQIAVDTLIAFFSGSAGDNQHDVVTSFFKGFLPGMKPENLFYILVSLGLIFLAISVLRGIFMFASSAISASSTEKAVKRLRDRLSSIFSFFP